MQLVEDIYNEVIIKVNLGLPFVIIDPLNTERYVVGQKCLGQMRVALLRTRTEIKPGDYAYMPEDFIEFYKVEYELYRR